jgi:ferredoxin
MAGGAAVNRLVVDWEQCDGHGLCGVLLPELVDLDEWGFPVVGVAVPADLTSAARAAVRACPALALRLRT